MRAAALLVILAIAAAADSGSRCAVACVRPAAPPCHHSPEKAAKTCDSSVEFGERRPVAVVETPAAGPAVAILSLVPPASSEEQPGFDAAPRRHPPGEAAPHILRI
jgi:hypothetical protein